MPFEISSSERKGWFSLALFRKNLARFWPLMVGYGLLQFFLLPMELLSRLNSRYFDYDGTIPATQVATCILNATDLSVAIGVAFGVLVAMALFSYLMNNRSAGMLHALPIRREGLFLTNWVTGLCFFLGPNLVVGLMALGAEGLCGTVFPMLTFRWFALNTVIAMFFFCFAVCCAMFTGHILALPVFYGVLNVLVLGMGMLVDNAMETLLVGYSGQGIAGSTLSRWFTPVWHLTLKVTENRYWNNAGSFNAAATTAALGYCVVLGAAFTLIAVVTYQHRQLERAGDVVTVGWVRPVFQYGVGVCVGLTFGTVLYENFFDAFGPWALVLGVALCAVVGSFVARMLLKKTLRVFAEGWKGCVALGICMLALLGGARADFFGYQRWVPDPAKVVGVRLDSVSSAPFDSGGYGLLTQEEEVEAVTRMHAALVAHLDELEEAQQGGIYGWTEGAYETATATWMRLEYEMADGSFQTRRYQDVPITAQALADPDSYAAQLQALINRPEMVKRSYLGNIPEDEITAIDVWLVNPRDEADGTAGEVGLTYSDSQKLWAAVLEDMNAGRFHRYLLQDRERYENCYYTDLCFDLNRVNYNEAGERETDTWDLRITVQKSATATMKALEELGLTEYLAQRESESRG